MHTFTRIALTLGFSSLALGSFNATANTLRVALNADIRSTDPGVNRDENRGIRWGW